MKLISYDAIIQASENFSKFSCFAPVEIILILASYWKKFLEKLKKDLSYMREAYLLANRFINEVLKKHEFNVSTKYYESHQKVKFKIFRKQLRCTITGIKATIVDGEELHSELYTGLTEFFIKEIFAEIKQILMQKGYVVETKRGECFIELT